MHQKVIYILCTVLLTMCLILAGCENALQGTAAPAEPTPEPTPEPLHFSAGNVEASAQTLKMTLTDGETALLNSMSNLRSADFSGSKNEEEIAAWSAQHPEVEVRYTVTLPNGTVLDPDTNSVDLSGMAASDCEAAARKIALLPNVKTINLGAEGGPLSWSDIARLREILPNTVFKYAFKLYGTDCNLENTTINLFRVPVTDNGNLIEEIIGYMPQLTYVDMDSCGLQPARLEEINLKYPDVKVVFRVYFGDNYTARTDTERILASMASRGGMLTENNVDGLYYCHDVKYLDLGHNTLMTNIGFVAQMPKLEVAILSMCNWKDATPLASCTELEYLEIANTYCSDLKPLSGLTKLRHLNVAGIGYDQPYDGTERIQLTDITPLYSLTGLERLWIGAYNPVPSEQIQEMQKRAPNCEIDLTVYEDPVGGRWRYIGYNDLAYMYIYHDRYIKLREQFDDYAYTAYNFTWNDPLCDPNYVPVSSTALSSAATPTPTPTIEPVYTPAPVYETASPTYESADQSSQGYVDTTYEETQYQDIYAQGESTDSAVYIPTEAETQEYIQQQVQSIMDQVFAQQ